METLVLAVVLVIAVAVLARIVWRSVRRAADTSSPACTGCPFIGDCAAGEHSRPVECEEGEDR